MTTDTPSTSGEGVDVLRVMQQCIDALCTHEHVSLAVMNNGAIRRIAKLIEAADAAPILSKYHGANGFEVERFINDYSEWSERKRAALAACLATQGAHR